jgi:hypothetical protein
VRGTLAFDPRERDYGPATAAVRTSLLEWAEIDWFAPSRVSEAEARRLFHEHNALARAYDPDLFVERVEVQCVSGGWAEFVELCTSVRDSSSWDWKLSILKDLSSRHADERGWSIADQAADRPGEPPRPGDLFYRYIGGTETAHVLWCSVAPQLDELGALPEPMKESAQFYFSYAQGDLLDCIKWQLAERSNDFAGNPFRALAHCYRAGCYPFSYNRTTATVFRFAAGGAAALPKATLLPKRGRGRRSKQ